MVASLPVAAGGRLALHPPPPRSRLAEERIQEALGRIRVMHILRLNQSQHATLASHLFDGTGLEAIAVGLCGRSMIEGRSVFVVHRIVEIPSDEIGRASCRERVCQYV